MTEIRCKICNKIIGDIDIPKNSWECAVFGICDECEKALNLRRATETDKLKFCSKIKVACCKCAKEITITMPHFGLVVCPECEPLIEVKE